MKPVPISVLCLAIGLLLTVGPVDAAAVFRQITPANLGRQQLALLNVTVTRTAHTRTFYVRVRPRPGDPYPFFMPKTTAWFENSNEGNDHLSLPDTATRSLKTITHGKQGVDFRFTVPDRDLARLRFVFGAAHYLSGDFFWFDLAAFPPSERVRVYKYRGAHR